MGLFFCEGWGVAGALGVWYWWVMRHGTHGRVGVGVGVGEMRDVMCVSTEGERGVRSG